MFRVHPDPSAATDRSQPTLSRRREGSRATPGASQAVVTRRCTEGPHRDVEVNLAALTFLDCGGYRALVAARTALGQHRRTLTVVGAAGEPRRLLELLGAVGPS